MVERDVAYNRFLLLKETGYGHSEAWDQYKQSRNKFINIWRNAKKKYYEDSFDKLKKDPKKLWNHLKTLYKAESKQINSVIIQDKQVFDSDEIANRLNQFFVYSVEEIVDNVSNENIPELEMRADNVSLSEFAEVDKEAVERIIKNLKNTKGPDGLSCEAIKNLWEVVGDEVTSVVQQSLAQKNMPKSLKTSVIVPIAKIKGSVNCNDFRPINTLPVIEKVIETVVHETLLKYISENRLLTKHQSGFREKHSTESALQLVIENWVRAMDRGEGVLAVFLDYKRAFETINRNLLLKKLREVYNITGFVYEWIEDYLSERFQTVRFNNRVSNEVEVKNGVPQGSKLGPLLFILYINDLPNVLHHCEVHMFADDTLIYLSRKDAQELSVKINEDLATVCDWLCMNQLCVNVQKTKCMALGKRMFRDDMEMGSVMLMGSILEWVPRYKYLGVIIDSNLSFKDHVEYINGKMAKKVNLLYRLRKTISKAGKIKLFKMILVPHIKYCSTVLSMANKNDISKLQNNFNKGMRAVLNKRRSENVNSMLRELGYLSVENEVLRDVLTFIYRVENGLLPEYLESLVRRNSDVHQYLTRQANQFHLEPVRTSKGLKSVFNNGIATYNAVPDDIKHVRTVGMFREKIGIWLGADVIN